MYLCVAERCIMFGERGFAVHFLSFWCWTTQNSSKPCLCRTGLHSTEFMHTFFFPLPPVWSFTIPSAWPKRARLDRLGVMQSKRIVFQCSSAACGNRAVKRAWMTEVCTLVSLLIVVWCLHAFGPRTTTTVARGSLTAKPWVRAVCWKGALSRGSSSAEQRWVRLLFMDGYTRLTFPSPVCLCSCGCVCVRTYARRGEERVLQQQHWAHQRH